MKRGQKHADVGAPVPAAIQVCADVQVLPESHSRLYFSFQAIAAMSRQWLFEQEQREAVRAVRIAR